MNYRKICLEFPFNLIGKLTMAFLTGQSWHILKFLVNRWGPRTPEQGFLHCFTDRLNQKV